MSSDALICLPSCSAVSKRTVASATPSSQSTRPTYSKCSLNSLVTLPRLRLCRDLSVPQEERILTTMYRNQRNGGRSKLTGGSSTEAIGSSRRNLGATMQSASSNNNNEAAVAYDLNRALKKSYHLNSPDQDPQVK